VGAQLLQVSALLYASKQLRTPAESGWLGYALGYECARCRPVVGADRGTGPPGPGRWADSIPVSRARRRIVTAATVTRQLDAENSWRGV
jgi:hypothetical protein